MGGVFFGIGIQTAGLEPLAVELSGGQFLTPVQTLVSTLVFAHRAKMQLESRSLHQAKTPS